MKKEFIKLVSFPTLRAATIGNLQKLFVVKKQTAKHSGRSPIETLGDDSLFYHGRRLSRGFTLIELLIVVLIIGILAAVALPQYQKAVAKTQLTLLASQTYAIRDALRMYQLANGVPASKFSDLDIWTSVDDAASKACLGDRCFFHRFNTLPYFNIGNVPQAAKFQSCDIQWAGNGGVCYITEKKGQEIAQSMGWENLSKDHYWIGKKSDWL